MIDSAGTDDTICVLIGPYGVDCEPCPGGGGDFCISARIEQITLPLIAYDFGFEIVEVTQADIAANPLCP